MRVLLALGFVGFAVGSLLAEPVAPAKDDRAERTVILVNARQRESIELGEFYAEQRGIPRANVIALPMPEVETISWREFVDQIWQPLQDELFARKWLDGVPSDRRDALGRRRSGVTGHRLAFLVTFRGTPLRIRHDPTVEPEAPNATARGAAPFKTNQGSVDAELALLPQPNLPVTGFTRNPVFGQRRAARVTEEFIIKVSRLDGPTWADAKRLITSALEAEQQGLIGRYYVDLKGPHAAGDRWLDATRRQLSDGGFFGEVHAGAGTFDPADRFDVPVLYFGWYAPQITGPFLRPGFRFPPGAIAFHIHSSSAETLRSTREQWCGPFVARGVAATFGNVFEPYLEFTTRPDLLVEQLVAGATLGDAAYYATPVLSWQTVIIGDPLYRPFKVTLAQQVAQLGTLPAELAGHVIARQAAVLDQVNLQDEARALFARGMRDAPSLALALALARYELLHDRPKAAGEALKVLAAMREFSAADWPLARAGAEFVAQHVSARDALPIYQTLVRSSAPTRDAQQRVLTDARKVADATGDLARSLEFARMATELAAAPETPSVGK